MAGNAQGLQGVQGTSGTLISRTTATGVSSGVVYINSTTSFTIPAYKSYSLLKLATNTATWVRLYTSNAALTADASRVQSIDPLPGTGIILDVVTTSSTLVPYTQPITPALIGFNDDITPTTNIYTAATNLSNRATTITVTLTLLQLET
jgi:hypothetical protein